MRKIRLNDGTEHEVDRCGANDGILSIRVIDNNDLLQLVEEFGKPQNTSHIEHWFDGTETDHVYFDGYTELIAAQSMREGILLTLRKG
jgi:hypothetical protein